MLSKSERIHYIIKEKCNGNASEMARRLGISQPAIASWQKRDTLDYDKVAEAFPDISAEWLLRGEGAFLRDVLVGGGTPAEGERAERSAQQYEEIIASLQQEIEILRARCAMLMGSR